MPDRAALAPPVVLFTGAGISVGAGLPTYRGTGGLYEDTDLEPPHARDVAPERLPGLWARFAARLRSRGEVHPSAAHLAIASLEHDHGVPVVVVTQNVDGLHRDAGSTHVVELHGSLREVRCIGDGHVRPLDAAEWGPDGVPRCPQCGAATRPNVVLFGEALPRVAWEQAADAIDGAGTVVAVGTSAQVFPAASLIGTGRAPHARRVWVNPETPPPAPGWEWRQGRADVQVPVVLGLAPGA